MVSLGGCLHWVLGGDAAEASAAADGGAQVSTARCHGGLKNAGEREQRADFGAAKIGMMDDSSICLTM